MGKDFKSFSDEHKKNVKDNEGSGGGAEEESGKYSQDDVKKIYKKYADKSESEITEDLMRAVNRGKRSGNFNIKALENNAKSIMPMLNSEQRQKLENIMKMIKDNE
jgi:hypothetical protein